MQIILVQAEVEQAIKDYIANRVTLAEGSDIAIDLKAGRGPEGFTANIDIVPSEEPATPAVPSGPLKRNMKPAKADPASDTSSPTEAPMTGESTDAADVETSSAETASDEGEATAAPAKSLFAGLKRPVNS